MRIKYECLPCLVNQVVKVANMTNATQQDELFKKVFHYLGDIDFNKTNPEVIGATFKLLKQHIHNEDPYKELRHYYNVLFLDKLQEFENKIKQSNDPFRIAIYYAILGNIIDFNPMHNTQLDDVMHYFDIADSMSLAIDNIDLLKEDLSKARTVLYLGDNCGEICLDRLFIKIIKEYYPQLTVYFGTRGAAVVNDSIEEDAYFVKMDEVATIINNGDDSLGTILTRTSKEFNTIYENADIVITKGQANYESLSEEKKDIYFLLMAKCEVIANDLNVPIKSMVCKKLY